MAVPYKPMADSSVAPLADVERRAHEREWFSQDLREDEDRIRQWRAVSLFGVLLSLEGFLFTMYSGIPELYLMVDVVFVLTGVLIFMVGSLFAPAIGEGFGYAVLAAAVVAVAFGLYLQQVHLAAPLTLTGLWSGADLSLAAYLAGALQLGGATLAVLALVLSFVIERRMARD